MGVFAGPLQPPIDVNLNPDNSVGIKINNLPASSYSFLVDGFAATTVGSATSIIVSPGLTRNLTINAYDASNNLIYSTSKYIKIFEYVGTSSTVGWAQTWTVPPGVRYLFADVQGAQGGDSGGFGGRQKAYISVSSGQTLYFYCGGAGQNSTSVGCTSVDPGFRIGGFNGGGDGGGKSDAFSCPGGQTTYSRGASGGGASDIRTSSNDLNTRLIVAGGGGGVYGSFGGSGGNDSGNDGGFSIGGPWTSSVRGTGATLTGPGIGGTSAAGVSYYGNNGLLGIGGTGARFVQFGDAGGVPGGGGGGYFGGGGGGAGSNYGAGGGGGGGSGFIDLSMRPLLFSNSLGSLTTGYRTGNGRILVSWASPLSYSDIVTSGLVLNLDAQNYYSYPGSGTTWTDLSGNGNTGTLTNGPTYSSTNGGSIVFDGTNDRVTITNPLLSSTGNWSISSWFNLSALPVAATNDTFNLFSQYIAVTNNGRLCLFVRNDGTVVNKFEIFLGSGADYSNQRIIGTITAQTNTFYNLVATRNGSNFNLYVNGNLDVSQTLTGINITVLQSTPEIGGCISGNFGWLNGKIYNTSIYNRALTESEISQNFNALRGRFGI